MEAELGNCLKTTFVESVPGRETAAKTFRDLARDGNRVIFGATVGNLDAMLKVAKHYPDVRFEHATGDKTTGNLSTYEACTHEGTYLAGLLAGKTSKLMQNSDSPEVLKVGTGLVTDHDGQEVSAAGTRLDDAGLRRMHYFVRGVKGEIPG